MSLFGRLYRGQVHANFIGRRKLWYLISALIVLVCALSLVFKGFTLGIDFKGGALFQFPKTGHSIEDARSAFRAAGVKQDIVVQELSGGEFRVQTPELTEPEIKSIQQDVSKRFDTPVNSINVSTVGASWGTSITKKAVQGLIVFLVLVVVYLSIRYEWKMAASAMVALLHDLVITAGVYSLVGFEVTPSTVIALLTILGFSLYDTVVVFDKVRENTAGLSMSSRKTYGEAANDALNETLMRSINTSLIALIPVACLLFVGAGLLGAGTLKDLALAQFVGLASGAYSSIFIATPLLVDFKEREPKLAALTARVARQRADAASKEAADRAAGVHLAAESPGAGGRSATALLDRDRDHRHDDEDDDHGEGRAGAPEPSAAGARAGARGSRPVAGRAKPPPRKGGRSGRPGGGGGRRRR